MSDDSEKEIFINQILSDMAKLPAKERQEILDYIAMRAAATNAAKNEQEVSIDLDDLRRKITPERPHLERQEIFVYAMLAAAILFLVFAPTLIAML